MFQVDNEFSWYNLRSITRRRSFTFQGLSFTLRTYSTYIYNAVHIHRSGALSLPGILTRNPTHPWARAWGSFEFLSTPPIFFTPGSVVGPLVFTPGSRPSLLDSCGSGGLGGSQFDSVAGFGGLDLFVWHWQRCDEDIIRINNFITSYLCLLFNNAFDFWKWIQYWNQALQNCEL